jgi:hypothetical protein
MTLSFTDTRSRKNDDSTSKEAAKNAASGKADRDRLAIRWALDRFGPLTAREIARQSLLDYITVQRRISEVAGIEKTDEVRDGCRVWRAL